MAAFNLGLRGRLLLLVLAAFGVLTGVIVWLTLSARDALLVHALENLRHHANLMAARHRQIAERSDATLNGLMLAPELRSRSTTENCSRVLSEMQRRQTEFVQMGKASPAGEVVCTAVPHNGPINLAYRDYFRQALETRDMVVSDVVTSRSLGQPVIVFAKATRDETGRVSGVLWVSIGLAWLHGELVKAALQAGARLAVVDDEGAVAVRHPDWEGWTGKGKSIAHLPQFKRILTRGEDGTFEASGLDGVPKLHAVVPLLEAVSGRKYYLWLSVPKAAVVAAAQRQLLVSLAIALTVLAGMVALIVWIANRLVVQPLLALSQAAARFGAGDFDARSGLAHTQDEVGRLAKTLDEAATTIQAGERRRERRNRALRVHAAGNRALLRAGSELDLATEMCRSLVEAGGYRLAWIGYAESDREKNVRPVAACGVEAGSLDELKMTWDGTGSSRGPIGTAIRQGIPVATYNVLTDPDYRPWQEQAKRYGYASSLALPLRIDGGVIGAIEICATEADAFDRDVVELLSEVASDVAFGIATKRAQAEHKRTRAALRTAEERFRAAAEASLDALFILASVRGAHGEILDFQFTDINPGAKRMLGMAREQVVGQRLCELIPATRTEGLFDKYVAVTETGTPLEQEFVVDAPQGGAKWLRQQIVRVGGGIAISSRDVTDWKKAGAALKESEESFRVATDSVRDAFIILDREGLVTWWNAAAEAMFGYRRDEIMGRALLEIVVPHRFRDAMRQGLARFAVSGEGAALGKTLDMAALRKSGEEFPVDLSLSAMRLRGSWFAVGIVHDTTARKTAAQSLARSNRALKTLSACNEALVRAASEVGLLQAVTRIIVEEGGYRLATVGYAGSDPEKSMMPVASFGVEQGYDSQERPTWADTEKGQVPIARAIRSGMPQICRDIASDPGFAPWRDAVLARGFASNIALPLFDGDRIFGGLNIFSSETDAFDEEEAQLLQELANDIAYGINTLRTRAERDRITYEHTHHAEILRQSLEQSIHAIADTVEARDPYTAGHQRRVGELAVAIAREMGLPEEKVHGIRLAAAVHDLGKIRVPAEILSKPGKLTDIEFMLIKTHAQAGYDILKDVTLPWPIADIVRQHHEKLDGSGYPQGLKDGQILLEARIMTVADVVEAMASHRPYRAALGIETALKEIRRGRGSAYDPAVVDACLKLFREAGFAFQA